MKRLCPLTAALALVACTHAPTPRDVFEAQVLPVLEQSCAAASCHGVAPDAQAHGEKIEWKQLFFQLDAHGAIADPDQAYRTAKRAINTLEAPEFSTLLRKPLSVRNGGLGHYGGQGFASPEDPAYRAIHAWISVETDGGEDPAPLDERERLFADTVQPVLVAATCMTSHCHGPTAGGIPFHLDIGYRGRFPVAATRHNCEQTLKMVTLDGYPRLSRVIRKAQPLGAGIVHKGLNFDFFAGDPGDGVSAITRFVCAERLARTGQECAAPDATPISGFVFVRGPLTAHHAFELNTFAPGSDLYLGSVTDDSLRPTTIENLTERLHARPADVCDPAVSRDGRQVLFSMRTSSDDGHHIWALDLVSREARQLTFGGGLQPGGGFATDRDPTWGPDGSVWFVSTRAGTVADQGRLLDAEIYSLDPTTGDERRWTYTPHVERKPVFFDVGDEAGGEVAFSTLRDAIPGQARAHIFRFPPSQRTEYHQHFGITPLQTFFYDMQELPDGRYVSVVGDLPAVWQAGGLAIIDRNFGPEINARSSTNGPALELYKPPMAMLAGEGAYRDPAPLPDGRIVVAHQPGPFDATDRATPFTPRIELIELAEAADGSGPAVTRTAVLLAESGVALTEPQPISVRTEVHSDGAPLPPSDEPTAIFRHQGMPMINALLSNLAPSGSKHALDGIAYVRLVEHLAVTRSERARIAADETQAGEANATSSALGQHGPARILAELPVETDGSFQARVPVGVPFRVQALDAAHMAIGVMHNRWYYMLAGQILNQGISAATGTQRYGSQCAACHGDPDGNARAPEMESPDTITGASLSLSRFERQNPRRPIEPPVLGTETRVVVDFRRDIQPILDRRCVSCHGESSPAAKLALTDTPTTHFNLAYENLLQPGDGSGHDRAYVDDGDGRARASYLIELVTGREMDAPRALPQPRVEHPASGSSVGAVTDDELLTLVRWIELGATFRGTGRVEDAP